MASIRDVAEHAGVSIATVSHVLNGTRKVADSTRKQVEEAFVVLNYRPNRIARSLRTSVNHTIGMVIPDHANPFFAETARGVEDAAFEKGYGVLLCNSDGSVDKENRYGESLIESMVSGVVLISTGLTSKLVDEMQRRNIPVVVVDRELPRTDVDAVLPEHFDGAVAATELLLQLGHTRIGCISSAAGVLAADERLRGFRQAMSGAGATEMVVEGDFQYEGGYLAAQQILRSSAPPTAIFACNDLMAIGALRVAKEEGLDVPGDLSIVGFDNIAAARFTNPALTTVAQPVQQIGSLATELLIRRIGDPSLPTERRTVTTELVERESTGSVPQ